MSEFKCKLGYSRKDQCHTRQLTHKRRYKSGLVMPMFASCQRCQDWLSDEEYAERYSEPERTLTPEFLERKHAEDRDRHAGRPFHNPEWLQ